MPDPDSTSRYQREEEIARGGMGAIFRVHDVLLDRTLAMKVALRGVGTASLPRTASEIELARFVEEARVTAQLDHPGVVPVHELGVEPDTGRQFFTMKLVKGRELGQVFDLARAGSEGWNLSRAVGVLVTVCQTVAYAHAKHVVHRDLKPANVMVGRFGEVHVMDWGLAKVLDKVDLHDLRVHHPADASLRPIRSARATDAESSSESSLQTQEGSVMGTPAYMPPEQARGQLDLLDARSDIYSLGAILYRLLTGHAPYHEDGARIGVAAQVAMVVQGPPRSVRDLAPDAPPELVAICEKAMSRDREQRYRSGLEMAEDLQAWLDGRVVGAYGGGAFAELRAWVRRNRLAAVSMAAVLLVAIAGLAGVLLVQSAASRRVGEERDRAQAAVVDLHAQAGARLALQNQHADAALFFAQAAALSNDPRVRADNLVRSRSWLGVLPELTQVAELPGDVTRARFHPDGVHALLLGWRLGTCRVLDTDSGELLAIPALDHGATTVATWSPDGSMLAVGRDDGEVRVLAFPSLDELAAWSQPDAVSVLDFDPQGTSLAVGGASLRFFDVGTWRVTGGEVAHAGTIVQLRFASGGRALVSVAVAGKESALRLFRRAPDGALAEVDGSPFPCLSRLERPRDGTLPLVLPGRDVVVWATTRRTLRVHDLESDTARELEMDEEFGGVDGLMPLREPNHVLVLGWRGVRCWDLAAGKPLGAFLPIPNESEHAVLDPKLPLAYVASFDGRLRMIPVPGCEAVTGTLLHSKAVSVVALGDGGRRLLTAQSGGPFVRVWRLDREEPGPPALRIEADLDDNPVNLSADGRSVLFAGWNSSRYHLEVTRVYDLGTGAPIGPELRPGTTLNAGALSADGEMAALLCAPTAGTQDGARAVRADTQQPGRVHVVWSRTGLPIVPPIDTAAQPLGGAFRPDGRELAVVLANDSVLAIALPAGTARAVGPTGGTIGITHTQRDRVRYAAGGAVAVTFGQGRGAWLWDTATWTSITVLEPERNVIDVQPSADGAWLATGTGAGGIARVWDAATGAPLGPELEHPDRVFRARFSPDGRTLLTACRDEFGRLWDWRTGELLLPPLEHGGEVFDVGFSPDGRALYTCGNYNRPGEVRTWSAHDGLPLLPPVQLAGMCAYMPMTADGRAVCGTTTGLEVLDLGAWMTALASGGSIERQVRACEVVSGRRVLPGGGVITLMPADWFERWRTRPR